MAVAVVLRLGPLDPSSLWIDDAWPTLVSKAGSLHDVLLTGVTAPGFAVLLKGWLAVVGFSELKAQLLPFVAGVGTPAAVYFVLRRAGISRGAAALGALVLASSVVHMTYSTRVKEYTLDTLTSLCVLAVAWWLVQDVGSRRRWWIFAATSLGGIVLASPVLALSMSSTAVALATVVMRRRDRIRIAIPPSALVAFFAAAWWWLLLRPRVNESLKEYWAGYFIPRDRGLAHAAFVAVRGVKDVCWGAINLPTAGVAVVMLIVVATLLGARRLRALLLFVVAPLGLAVGLAAARAVPLGTGRTDTYLYPGLALAIAVAVDENRRRWPRLTAVFVCSAVALAAGTFKSIGKYPARDIRPLVLELAQRMTQSDGVLIRPDDDFAFALYTHWPITFVRARAPAGFAVRIDHPNVRVPRLVPVGPGLRWESWQHAISELERSSREIWLVVGGHDQHPTLPYVRGLLEKAGYTLDLELSRPGADLSRWSDTRR